MFDPFLSVYKSGDECVKTFGGLEVQILVIFSWRSILFLEFLGGIPVPVFTQRAGILAIIAC